MLISACCFSERRDLSYGGYEAILTRRFGHGQYNKKVKIVEIFNDVPSVILKKNQTKKHLLIIYLHLARNVLLFMHSIYFNELYMFMRVYLLEHFILNELSLSFFTEQKFTAVWYHFCTIFQTATWYIENGKTFCKTLFF